ncbi:MAG TPA: R3H domain-containing nucleic acid-binding protein [bacterium]|nr:R3H domain-containing nucleic acid-binding protein [bacterium]
MTNQDDKSDKDKDRMDGENGEAEPDDVPADEQTQPEAEPAPAPEPLDLDQVAKDAAAVAREILELFPHIEMPKIEFKIENESVWVEIEGDPTGRLIGKRGQTIDAFQHIISKIMSHRLRRKITINVDAEQYKRRHNEKLIKLARETADYVAQTANAMALDPMSPADRRIVHITLKDRKDVITMSEGKDIGRFVVIWPRKDDE